MSVVIDWENKRSINRINYMQNVCMNAIYSTVIRGENGNAFNINNR